jgi:hypothetical protein
MLSKTFCEIHVQDVLDEKLAEYFAPFTIVVGEKETVLAGVVLDQAELFGVLWKIRDLGVTLLLLSVTKQQE